MMDRVLATLAIVAGATFPSGPHPADDGAGPIGEIRQAKIGLTGFVLDHIDRPLRIDGPCPSIPAETAAASVSALGLVPSTREYGAAIVFDGDVGGGLAALRCGVDLARSADPQGSTALSADVTMLDGQATFDQYAVALAGTDVAITDVVVPGLPADGDRPSMRQAARCTNGGRDCVAALSADDLVVTVRLRDLPPDTGEQLARQLVVAVTPEVIANLAGLTAPNE